MKKEIIEVGIVDDETLIVELLESFITKLDDMTVCLTANSGNELMKLLENSKQHPEIILLDLRMQGKDGIEVSLDLKAKYPDIKIIVISSYYKVSFTGYMLKTGVNAFIPKGVSPTDLSQIIRTVMDVGYYFTDEQMDILKNQISSKSPKPTFVPIDNLSDRELDVLKLICQQLTAGEIADKLFITRRTVEGHKSNMMQKAGVKNVAGLVIYAVQNGLVDPHEYLI